MCLNDSVTAAEYHKNVSGNTQIASAVHINTQCNITECRRVLSLAQVSRQQKQSRCFQCCIPVYRLDNTQRRQRNEICSTAQLLAKSQCCGSTTTVRKQLATDTTEKLSRTFKSRS